VNHVLLDRALRYRPALRPLVEASGGVIQQFDLDGWDFGSYADLIKRKLVVPQKHPVDKVNPSLLFVGNFSERNARRAEGLVSQILTFMYDKTFLYYFGNVKTLVWMQSPGWQFLVAEPGHPRRKKMTVLREFTADVRVIARTDDAVKQGGEEEHPMMLPNENEVVNLSTHDFDPHVGLWLA
jgi:Ribosomal RNA adenine dimethylase